MLPGDGQGQLAILHPGHFASGRRVRVAAERLAGHDLPVPQLHGPRRVGRADDRARAAGRAAPEDSPGVGAADPDAGLAAHVNEQGDGNTECVGDPGQGGEVRVGPALLERDQHALADPGSRGELIQ
jgi:hypothetical protein